MEIKSYYSVKDSESDTYDVSLIINRHLCKTIINFIPLPNRIIILQFNIKLKMFNFIKTYAPMANKDLEKILNFYKELEELYNLTREDDIDLIIGDLDAKIEKKKICRELLGNCSDWEWKTKGKTF